MSASDFRANNIVANLTGSLTELSNGDPYLLAGTGIEILTGSNGQVIINNVAGDITNVIAGAGLNGGGDTGDVTLSLDESSNRNVDHSSVNINAGSGLTGGGSIDSDVNLSVNSSAVPFLSTENTFIEDNIFLSNIYIDDPTGYDLIAGKEILGTVTTTTPPDPLNPTASPTQTVSQKMYINLKDDKYVFGEDRDETDFNSNSPINATDVKILLSGSAGSKDGSTRGVTLVTGDLVVSGTLYDGAGNITGVNISNNVDNRIITATGNSSEVNAEDKLSFNGTALSVTGSVEITDYLNLLPNRKINFNTPGQGDVFIQYDNNSLTIESDDYLNIRADQNIEISAFRQYLDFDFGSMTTYRIQNDPWGTIFNRGTGVNSDEADFSVNSLNNQGILYVDSGLDVVVLGANDLEGQGSGPNDTWSELIGDDVNVFISGSAGSKDSATRGVTLVSGDLVVSGNIYDKYGNTSLNKSQQGYFGITSAGLTNNNAFLINTEYAAANNPASQGLTLYNTRVNANRGKVVKAIIKIAQSTGINTWYNNTGGITGSCWISNSTIANYTSHTGSANSIEIIKKDFNGSTPNYSSIVFNFTGSNYQEGSLYNIGINFGNNWDSITGLPSPCFLFYEIITTDFVD